MPQLLYGPTLAESETQRYKAEKKIKDRAKAKGVLSKRGAKELAKIKANGAARTGATARERARQRAIYKEMRRRQLGKKNAPSARRYNSLFKESDRIAARARKRAAELEALAAKKKAKAKEMARAKKAKAAKAAKKAKPVKKAAKRVSKTAKKSSRRTSR